MQVRRRYEEGTRAGLFNAEAVSGRCEAGSQLAGTMNEIALILEHDDRS
jgi:hypothetical protein